MLDPSFFLALPRGHRQRLSIMAPAASRNCAGTRWAAFPRSGGPPIVVRRTTIVGRQAGERLVLTDSCSLENEQGQWLTDARLGAHDWKTGDRLVQDGATLEAVAVRADRHDEVAVPLVLFYRRPLVEAWNQAATH
jgi:hypothetical protein